MSNRAWELRRKMEHLPIKEPAMLDPLRPAIVVGLAGTYRFWKGCYSGATEVVLRLAFVRGSGFSAATTVLGASRQVSEASLHPGNGADA